MSARRLVALLAPAAAVLSRVNTSTGIDVPCVLASHPTITPSQRALIQ